MPAALYQRDSVENLAMISCVDPWPALSCNRATPPQQEPCGIVDLTSDCEDGAAIPYQPIDARPGSKRPAESDHGDGPCKRQMPPQPARCAFTVSVSRLSSKTSATLKSCEDDKNPSYQQAAGQPAASQKGRGTGPAAKPRGVGGATRAAASQQGSSQQGRSTGPAARPCRSCAATRAGASQPGCGKRNSGRTEGSGSGRAEASGPGEERGQGGREAG